MSGRFTFTPLAERDLEQISDYISLQLRNPQAARRVVSDIIKGCAEVARIPSLGHRRPDLTRNPEALFYCVRDYYLVIYQKNSNPMRILRVFHGSRDLSAELRED